MKIKKRIIRALLFSLIAIILPAAAIAKQIECEMTKAPYAEGWIPENFVLEISEDRSSAEVLRPKGDSFSRFVFKKAFLGSDLWARGKGKSNSGQSHNYAIQLRLKDNDQQVKVQFQEAGYQPLHATFKCRPNGNKFITSGDTTYEFSTNKANEVVLSNSESELFFNHSNTQVKVVSTSTHMKRIVNALRQNKAIKVAIIVSDSWYKPEQYEFTYYTPASVFAINEGGADAVVINDFELSKKLRAAYKQGKNVYLSGSMTDGAWAWSRFQTK